MNWTTEVPTTPGCYWVMPVVGAFKHYDSVMIAELVGADKLFTLLNVHGCWGSHRFSHYLGPIAKPTPP